MQFALEIVLPSVFIAAICVGGWTYWRNIVPVLKAHDGSRISHGIRAVSRYKQICVNERRSLAAWRRYWIAVAILATSSITSGILRVIEPPSETRNFNSPDPPAQAAKVNHRNEDVSAGNVAVQPLQNR